MIDLKISNNRESQFMYEEMNRQFYQKYYQKQIRLFSWIRSSQENSFYTELVKKQKKIEKLLLQLSENEQSEWSEHIFLKIKQLSLSPTNQTIDELLEKLYLLTKCGAKFNLPIFHKHINQIIKQTYYEIYKDKIIPLFEKSKFDVQQFKVFQYQDPWYTRLWRVIAE